MTASSGNNVRFIRMVCTYELAITYPLQLHRTIIRNMEAIAIFNAIALSGCLRHYCALLICVTHLVTYHASIRFYVIAWPSYFAAPLCSLLPPDNTACTSSPPCYAWRSRNLTEISCFGFPSSTNELYCLHYCIVWFQFLIPYSHFPNNNITSLPSLMFPDLVDLQTLYTRYIHVKQ